VTLILTTHYMDEAEQLCDRLAVMDAGRIAAEGSPRALIDRYATPEVLELRFGLDEHVQAGEKIARLVRDDREGPAEPRRGVRAVAPAGRWVELLPDRVLLYTPDASAALAAVRAAGLVPVTTLTRRGTMEDVFLQLTGRSLVD
jgi:lipooligosaccharide transport system ATP-binding protein